MRLCRHQVSHTFMDAAWHDNMHRSFDCYEHGSVCLCVFASIIAYMHVFNVTISISGIHLTVVCHLCCRDSQTKDFYKALKCFMFEFWDGQHQYRMTDNATMLDAFRRLAKHNNINVEPYWCAARAVQCLLRLTLLLINQHSNKQRW